MAVSIGDQQSQPALPACDNPDFRLDLLVLSDQNPTYRIPLGATQPLRSDRYNPWLRSDP